MINIISHNWFKSQRYVRVIFTFLDRSNFQLRVQDPRIPADCQAAKGYPKVSSRLKSNFWPSRSDIFRVSRETVKI